MASVTKRGNGYRIRVYLGYDSAGKQIERTMTWTPPAGSKMTDKEEYREALHQSILFEEKLRYSDNCDGRIKLADFAELWFKNYAEPNLRPKTIARYQEMFNLRIKPYLGHFSLDKLRPPHLLAFYRSITQEEESSSYRSNADLKKLVSSKKYSNSKFAKECGISVNTLRAAYQKENVSFATAEKISKTLNYPLSSLFCPSEEPKRLSPTTIHHHHRLLSNMLNDAKNWGYINENPCSKIDAPKAAVPEISFMDQDLAKKFVTELWQIDNPGYYRRPLLVLLLTGLRRSEICGICWDDIDWKNKTLRIVRTSQIDPKTNHVYTDGTKNASSKRILYLSDQVLDLLRDQWLWQKAQEKLPTYEKQKHNRVFTMPNGNAMHPNRLTTWFKTFIRKTDLPQDLHLHSLRHTFASIAIGSGAPLPVVSKILGHSKPSTTSDIYVHVIAANQIATAASVANVFSDLF